MKKNTKRIWAILLAAILVLNNFTGVPVAKATGIAAIFSVQAAQTEVTNEDREVAVTVTGEYLPETMYYRIYEKDASTGYDTKIQDNTEIVTTGDEAKRTFTVTLPENTSEEDKVLKVGVNYQSVPNGWMKTGEITLHAAGDVEEPGEPEAPATGILSDETTFRAKVVDEAGNAVNDVVFTFNDGSESIEVKSADGKIERAVGKWEVYKEFTVALKAGQGWACETTCEYYQGGDYVNGAKLAEINGKTLAEAGEVVFVLKASEGEEPGEPEAPATGILSDETTFRAKVVDEAGNAVNGAVFTFNDGSESIEVKSADGKIERAVGKWEVYKEFTVALKAGQGWACETTCEYYQGGDYANGAKLTEINGKTLAEAGEVVFVLKAAEGGEPEVPEEPDVPAEPEVDAKVLNVKTVDKDGNPVANVPLVMESEYVGQDVNVGSTNAEGILSHTLKYEMDTYYLKPVEGKGFSCAEPVEIFIGADADWNPIVETVDGDPYTGEVVLVVESQAVVAEPSITSAAFTDSSVSKDGATVAVTVKGENLPDTLYYSRQYMGDDGYGGTMATTVDWTGVAVEATGTATEKTINVPLDSVETYPKAIAWKVKVGLSSNTYDGTYKTSGELKIDGLEEPKKPEITAVATSKDAIDLAGETITVTVTGKDLPESVYYKVFYTCEEFTGDMLYEYMGKQIALTGTDTEKTFEVQIPAASESMDTVTGWKVGVGLTQYGTYTKSALMSLAEADGVQINETTFPDEEFRRYVTEKFDTDADGKLQEEELQAATDIDFEWGEYWVTDLTGIEYFVNLESLNCAMVGLTMVDVSENVKLTYLDCSYNEELEYVDVKENVKLQELHCYETPLDTLNVSNNTELVRLDCNNTKISTLDVSNCTKLFALNVENTKLTSIDISKNTELYEAYISFTDIEEFDISNNPKMGQIRFEETKVTSMDFSKNPELVAVRCANTAIKELDFSSNPKMVEIYCFGTDISTLDVSGMSRLETLECYDTNLTSLDVTNNTKLVGLACGNTGIKSLDVTNLTELKRLECNDTKVANLDLSNNQNLTLLNVSNTEIAEMKNFDASNLTALEELYCNNAGVKSLNLSANAALYSLDCGNNALTELDLSGVGYLWYMNTISPQAAETTVVVKDGKLVLDMNTVVADITKVVIPESDAYTYDAQTGVITFDAVDKTKVAYTYDHGYLYGLDPMHVTLTVYGAPKAPATAKAVLSGGHDDVKFTWSKVEGADGYLVSYKKATAAAWSNAVTTTNLSYVKKDLADNVKYSFKVVPYKTMDGKKVYDTAQYKIASITTKKNVKAPATMKVNLSGGYDDVKISWSKVTGAAGYYVSMKKAGAATFTRIATTTNLSFVKKNLADGVKYTFQVVPYYKNGTTNVRGFYSKTAVITTLKKLTVPTLAKVSSTKVKVSWTNIAGETGYQISRSTKQTGTNIVSTIATTTGKTKTLTVTKGTKYYYKVRAYKTVNGTKIFGPWSNVKAYTLK